MDNQKLMDEVFSHPFFNKMGFAKDVMVTGSKPKTKAVMFYRKLKNNSFSEKENDLMKEELIKFANNILSICNG